MLEINYEKHPLREAKGAGNIQARYQGKEAVDTGYSTFSYSMQIFMCYMRRGTNEEYFFQLLKYCIEEPLY